MCAALEKEAAFADGAWRLEQFRVKRLRLRDESGCWAGTYLLTVTNNANGITQTLPVLGKLYPPMHPVPIAATTPTNGAAFGTSSWHCYLPALRLELAMQLEDRDLPALRQLTDAEAALTLLEESIYASSAPYPHLRLQACRPQIMRYKPGSRCTILYHLTYDADRMEAPAGPPVVVAKTYRGGKGENAYHAMRALWASPLGRSQTVAIAEPLAYRPDLRVLIQGPISEEQTLKELLRTVLDGDSPTESMALDDYLRKTAQGLAELHGCGVDYGELATWEGELAELLERRARLALLFPSFAGLAEPLLARLRLLAAQYPADPARPAHRSFRPAQVLLHKGAIGFIDFDGFCQSEPAMDLALFMTTLKNIALNKSSKVANPHMPPTDDEEDGKEVERLDEAVRLARWQECNRLCGIFLAEYEKHATVSRPRIVLWETVYLLDLILGSWVKIKFAWLDNCMFMLEEHLQENGQLLVA